MKGCITSEQDISTNLRMSQMESGVGLKEEEKVEAQNFLLRLRGSEFDFLRAYNLKISSY